MASKTEIVNDRLPPSGPRNEGSRTPGPMEGVRNSIVDLISDFLHLIELQAKMFGIDASTAWEKSKPAILLVILSIGGLLAALPVFCIGIASGIAIATGMQLWLCQIITGGAITLLSVLFAYAAVRKVRSALSTFSRSQHELESNVSWLRTSLEASQGKEPW